MLRVLFCISCCGVPPNTRSTNKRQSSSNLNLRLLQADGSKRALQDQTTAEEKIPQDDKTKFITLAASEKDQLIATQSPTNNENYGTKLDVAQGKLSLPVDSAEQESALDRPHVIDDRDPLTASTSVNKQLRQEQQQFAESERYHDIRLEASLSGDERSVSPGSSVDMEAYTESRQAPRAGLSVDAPDDDDDDQDDDRALEKLTRASAGEQGDQQLAESSKLAPRNVPTRTTKIGDYARIEYSPVEDLDSVTTMSYSRLGSERGARSQAGSTLSRQNSLGRTTAGEEGGGATTEGSLSRRSSQGGIESTSLSFASQLSNEQFQQNLTNMLESVNSNYPTFDTIGLPLGPPIDAATETTKTSPETPGAALTSASQDSLSDTSFNGANNSPKLSRPVGTLRSNQSSGGALVNDSVQERVDLEEMAELSKPAPLATAEDERLDSTPYTSVVTSKIVDKSKAPGDRVGSPQSFTTTTSGGLTNPTPTPSEMSTGSGKTKKKLKAKALFKKFKPGSKKKNKDDDI